jgi:serine protease Do
MLEDSSMVTHKYWYGFSVVFLSFLLAAIAGPVQAEEKTDGIQLLEALNDALAESSGRILPAVVDIRSSKVLEQGSPFEGWPYEDFLNRQWRNRQGERMPRAFATGSGVIIDGEKGYVLTNNHVVEDAEDITVVCYDNEGFEHEFKGEAFADPKTELALVKITNLDGKVLPEAKLGDSDKLRVGEIVLAVGNPFQMSRSVSMGVVSAKERWERSPQFIRTIYQDFIQTDAAINRGNSGGPLVNIYGEVVGINTFIYSTSEGAQGVGFSIAINLAKPVVEQLINYGRVNRPYLGVGMVETRRLGEEDREKYQIAGQEGVVITEVHAGSPADKAGLRPYDVLVEFGGRQVESSRALQDMVLGKSIEDEVPLKIYRPSEKDYLEKIVILAEQPEDLSRVARRRPETSPDLPGSQQGETESASRLGMVLEPLTEKTAQRYDYRGEDGLLVREVVPDSTAQKEGIQENDVILMANFEPVTEVEDLDRVIEQLKAENQSSVLLEVIRGSLRFMAVLDLQ